MIILVGCEESQAVTIQLRKLGHEAYSCDKQKCSGGHPEWHLNIDVFEAIKGGKLVTEDGTEIFIGAWDMAVFFPDCTFLTCSAEWAYKDGPYHQKVKPETLTGEDRRRARIKAIDFFLKLYNCHIPKVAIENPVGIMSAYFRKPDQIIQPWMFGENASKSTCLWLKNLPVLFPTQIYPARIVNGKKRYGNQTDAGQNNLPPSVDRAKLRSKTYLGIAKAMAEQWTN